MQEYVINVDLTSPQEGERLTDALDSFTSLRCHQGVVEDAAVMVRTRFKACGALSKQLVFPDSDWAADFLSFWQGKAA